MEKAAVAGFAAGSCRAPPGRWYALALAACGACPPAPAQDLAQPLAESAAEARTDAPPLRVQVRTSALPRLDAQDSGFQAPRIDVSLSRTGGTGLAPVLGMSGFSTAPPGAAPQLQPPRPGLDIGLRWSHTLHSQQQVDITAWRRMNADDDAYTLTQLRDPVYAARVEWNLASARRSGLAMDRGFLGFQLESGARISVRRKDGRPMFYYRSSF